MPDNDWFKWRKLVISGLERVEALCETLRTQIEAIHTEQALLKQEIENLRSSVGKEHTDIVQRLDTIEKEVMGLRIWRATLLGAAAAVSAVVSLLFKVFG